MHELPSRRPLHTCLPCSILLCRFHAALSYQANRAFHARTSCQHFSASLVHSASIRGYGGQYLSCKGFTQAVLLNKTSSAPSHRLSLFLGVGEPRSSILIVEVYHIPISKARCSAGTDLFREAVSVFRPPEGFELIKLKGIAAKPDIHMSVPWMSITCSYSKWASSHTSMC